MTLEEKVKARIVELKAGLDQYIKDADKQIAMYQVSIAELQLLIKPEPVPEPAIVPFNEPFPGTTGTTARGTYRHGSRINLTGYSRVCCG